MRRFERRLRLATGLIIACFVIGHFLNHSLGVVSIDAMDRLRAVLAAWWRSAPGTVLLYGSLLTHFALIVPLKPPADRHGADGMREFRRKCPAGHVELMGALIVQVAIAGDAYFILAAAAGLCRAR